MSWRRQFKGTTRRCSAAEVAYDDRLERSAVYEMVQVQTTRAEVKTWLRVFRHLTVTTRL
jgi:hypothetical protein